MPVDQVSVSLRKIGDPWTKPWGIPLGSLKHDPTTGEWYAIREIDAVQVQVSIPVPTPAQEDA
jgi:hypothetical protein